MSARLPAPVSVFASLAFLLSSIGCWAEEFKPAEILNVEAEFQRLATDNNSIEFGFGALWAPQGDKLLRIDAANNSLAELDLEGGTTRQRTVAVGEGAIWIADAMGRGSARSWPAMSNAVPWSGAVRMIGRPSVTLTPSSKWSALSGIKAWSWYMQSAAS